LKKTDRLKKQIKELQNEIYKIEQEKREMALIKNVSKVYNKIKDARYIITTHALFIKVYRVTKVYEGEGRWGKPGCLIEFDQSCTLSDDIAQCLYRKDITKENNKTEIYKDKDCWGNKISSYKVISKEEYYEIKQQIIAHKEHLNNLRKFIQKFL